MPDPTIFYDTVPSPLGILLLTSNGEALTGLYMPEQARAPEPGPAWVEDGRPFMAARAQLQEYFAGVRRQFDLPLAAAGTPFQRRVWRALCRIPFGATWSYAGLARAIGAPAAVRAVGAANGRNPVSIVVPCHRVVGSDGSLTGYAGGVDNKRRLLDLERAALASDQRPAAPAVSSSPSAPVGPAAAASSSAGARANWRRRMA